MIRLVKNNDNPQPSLSDEDAMLAHNIRRTMHFLHEGICELDELAQAHPHLFKEHKEVLHLCGEGLHIIADNL